MTAMDEDDEIVKYLEEHHECYDRFSFDDNMRYLLSRGYDHEDALQMIYIHCALSALIFQERVHNKMYQKITTEEKIMPDLKNDIRLAAQDKFDRKLKNNNRLS